LNQLTDQITLYNRPMESEPGRYDLICANLRTPTLVSLSRMVTASLKKGGGLVLSGVRPSEKDGLIATYAAQGCELVWHRDEKSWSGFVFSF
jgi:ribosomal protein L11 methylase PrmA